MLRFARYVLRRLTAFFGRFRPKFPVWAVCWLRRKTPSDWYACFARGVAHIPHLEVFLGKPVLLLPAHGMAEAVRSLGGCSGVVMWGVKEALPAPGYLACLRDALQTSSLLILPLRAFLLWISRRRYTARLAYARDFSARNNLPLLRLEDGFLRSLDLGVKGCAPLSLVIDRSGMYYDATRPSDLENLLQSDWVCPEELLDLARQSIDVLLHADLSKYNHAPLLDKLLDKYLLPCTGRPRILVLDQTAGDVSVILGQARPETFTTMLASAIHDHPGCDLYVKTHPDVLSGRKKGYLPKDLLPPSVRLIACDVAPLSLLRAFDEVYTVSSQMGFEALLLGKTVHCFGLPFYAGYGLTCDAQKTPRRNRRRTLLEVFAASYLLYPRYLDPTGERLISCEQTAQLLRLQRTLNEKNRGLHVCLGFSKWKHPHAEAFLSSTDGRVVFHDDPAEAVQLARKERGDVVVWASRMPETLPALCAKKKVPLLRMEDGFVRSKGLGSNFLRPGSLVLDDLGIYYDPRGPSRLEAILNEERSPDELKRAQELIQVIVHRGISKYNVQGENDLPVLPKDKRIILVPGQVEDDASVRLGGLGIYKNADLLASVRRACPDAFILYKEHPDVVSGNRPGRIADEDLARAADGIVRSTPIEEVLPLCHEVHTLTSLTGFEALMRGLTVATYGGPFYAGWGLTRDRLHFERRRKTLDLPHLVAGTLLLYPRYYDWLNRMFVPCESFVDWLAKRRASV